MALADAVGNLTDFRLLPVLPAALAAVDRFEVSDEGYWRGQALLLTGDFNQANRVLSEYTGRLGDYAVIARAHAQVGQGREASARSLIKPLRDSDTPAMAAQPHARVAGIFHQR